MRPPTRSRASSTSTETPLSCRRRAAASPAAPAPITMACTGRPCLPPACPVCRGGVVLYCGAWGARAGHSVVGVLTVAAGGLACSYPSRCPYATLCCAALRCAALECDMLSVPQPERGAVPCPPTCPVGIRPAVNRAKEAAEAAPRAGGSAMAACRHPSPVRSYAPPYIYSVCSRREGRVSGPARSPTWRL